MLQTCFASWLLSHQANLTFCNADGWARLVNEPNLKAACLMLGTLWWALAEQPYVISCASSRSRNFSISSMHLAFMHRLYILALSYVLQTCSLGQCCAKSSLPRKLNEMQRTNVHTYARCLTLLAANTHLNSASCMLVIAHCTSVHTLYISLPFV